VLVVDGGSHDGPAELAARFGAGFISSAPGRGRQLAAGVAAARGTWLWLLHADTRTTGAALNYLLGLDPAPGWGRFDVRFAPSSPGLRLIAGAMGLRSRLTGICTGDQGMFVHRRLLEAAGGMPCQPLMEDIELSRRLKRRQRLRCPRQTITSSSRRWNRRGLLRTVASMWRFRLRYWLGADPDRLAREYYR
jgi:rSAM/selenodomain-associated transferase 2